MRRLTRTLYDRLNLWLDWHWEQLRTVDQVLFVYFMGMLGIMGLLLLRIVIVNGLW